MNKNLLKMLTPILAVYVLAACENNQDYSNNDEAAAVTSLIDVAQTSAQLASGTTFRIEGSSTDSTAVDDPRQGGGHHHGPGHGDHGCSPLDGVSLLPPTDELLAISEAESAGDFRGLRMSLSGGASVTNYNSSGDEVSLPLPGLGGPQGCSASGGQFGDYDSLLASIVRTEIDFGSGVTYRHDTVSITRAGKIIVTREGDRTNLTETITFENYSVNGIGIAGTKTRVSTFDEATASGTSTTIVSDGKITFADGTVGAWTTERSRVSELTLGSNGRPIDGTITTNVNTTVSDASGNVVYSHKTVTPLVEDLSCSGRRRAPSSGVVETNYREDNLITDFGSGSCDNRTVTITINGETTTRTIQ